MRVLITGAAGFIGSHFLNNLLRGDYAGLDVNHVTVLDKLTYSGDERNLSTAREDSRFSFVEGDICDASVVDETVSRSDIVVHFAAESHVDRSIDSALPFAMTNVIGTQTLLDAAVRHNLTRFVHVSTDEVYGSIDEGAWSETWPLSPNSPYSASKASSDLVALACHRTHELDVVVTRCSNNYGSHQFPEKVIPLFITNLLNGGTVPLYGDGGNVRDWLHVDDHCRGIALAVAKGRAGEVYNIGGGTELTNKELTGRLLDACDADWDRVEYVKDRQGHDRRYCVDITKITNELGYEPKVSFDRGLEETVQWYRDNRWWWEPLKERAACNLVGS